jgi:hypothetical protein
MEMFSKKLKKLVDDEYRRLNIAEGRYTLEDLLLRKEKQGVRSNQIKAVINVLSKLLVWWVVSCLLMFLLGAVVVGILATIRG